MTSQEIVDAYEAMVAISDQMLIAANANDWDRVVLLEQQCAQHLHALRDNEPQPMAANQRVQKVSAIRRILDVDRQIRDLAMPWMARLSALVNNTTTERRVARAYGI